MTRTLVKIRHGMLTLQVVLLLSKVPEAVIGFDVIPGVELEDIVIGLEVARPELERVGPLRVLPRVVRAMSRDIRLSAAHLESRDVHSQLLGFCSTIQR